MSKFLKFIVNIFLVCAILIAAAILIPPLAGVQTTIVDTASMDTNLPLGSITYSTDVDVSKIKTGDEVLKDNSTSTYAYIVKEINRDTDTFTVVNAMDQSARTEEITLRNSVPKVAVVVPYIGYVIIAMHSTEGIIIIALVVALIVILFILSELWREKPEDEEEEDEKSRKTYSFVEGEEEKRGTKEAEEEEIDEKSETAPDVDEEGRQDASEITPEEAGQDGTEITSEEAGQDAREITSEEKMTAIPEETAEDEKLPESSAEEEEYTKPTESGESGTENAPDEKPEEYPDLGDTREFHLETEPKQETEESSEPYDLSDVIEKATKKAAEEAEKDLSKERKEEPAAGEKENESVTAAAESADAQGSDGAAKDETPEAAETPAEEGQNSADEDEPEPEDEEPEEFVPVEHATLDELLDQAKKNGDEPDVSKDDATGITIVDYSGTL